MSVLDSVLPLGAIAAQTFGDCAIGEIVGHNYLDETVTLYVWDESNGTSEDRVVHYKGLRLVTPQ